MGGILLQGTTILAWFADTPGEHDLRILEAVTGDPAHNTTWEALAILIALRAWRLPEHVGASLEVRSDSMASIQVLFKLASSSPPLNLIAREVALDSAELSAPLDLLTHIPGVSNIIPDHLSRLAAPVPHQVPQCLALVPRTAIQRRTDSFWLTRADPK